MIWRHFAAMFYEETLTYIYIYRYSHDKVSSSFTLVYNGDQQSTLKNYSINGRDSKRGQSHWARQHDSHFCPAKGNTLCSCCTVFPVQLQVGRVKFWTNWPNCIHLGSSMFIRSMLELSPPFPDES